MSLENSGQRLRARLVGHADLAECQELLPGWLVLPAHIRAALPQLWTRLLWSPGFNADVIEDLSRPPGQRLVGLGMSLALDARWQARLRDDPPACVAARLYMELYERRFEPLSDRELAAANARGEVSYLVLHYAQRLTDLADPDTVNLLAFAMAMFRQAHGGHRLQEIYQEGVGPELEYLASMGFRPRTTRARDAGVPHGDPDYPELYGLTREEAARMLPGQLVRDVFQFTPPLLGFSASERKLLRLAVTDWSDEDIANELDLSENTIKKLWRSIHQRVTDQLPGLYSDPAYFPHPDAGIRGPEKRRGLIQYLRQHLEELRPHLTA